MFNPVHTRGALLAVAAVLLAAAVPNAAAQSPWGNRDVGRPAEGSIEIVDESTVLVAAAGSGIGGKADRFHFSYKHFYGDVDLTVRIDSVTRADADMQSGVMFRGALGSQAKSVALLYSPVSGVVLQSRYIPGRRSYRIPLGGARLPLWLRLAREGDQFTAYRSSNGVAWERVGATRVTMKTEIYAGLAATSGRQRMLSRHSFSSVELKATPPVLPVPWRRADVGGTPADGFSWTDSSAFLADSTSAGPADEGDALHYVFQPMTGDMTIEARAASLKSASPTALAGLMIRRDLSASSPSVLIARTPSSVWHTVMRGGRAAGELEAAGPPGDPGWLRLVRTGNLVQAYFSPDRVLWEEIGSQDVDLDETAYVGMAVASGQKGTLARGVFRGLLLHPGPPPVDALPIVEITSPWASAVYELGTTVAVGATASDSDGKIRRVDFYAGGALVGSADKAPFRTTFTGPGTPGTLTLTAVAFDRKGAFGSSEEVEIAFDRLEPVGEMAIAFTPSVDHQWVHHYAVSFYRAGSDASTAAPASVADIGKPEVVDGEITVDIHSLVAALPTGSYYAVVSAVASGAGGMSAPTGEFDR